MKDEADSSMHRLELPPLHGPRVQLRPLRASDQETLYAWATDPLEAHLWRGRRDVPTREEFSAELEEILQRDLAHFAVEGRGSGRLLGWAFAYSYSAFDEYCYVTVYVVPAARRFGAGVEATVLLVDHLFRAYPLHKLGAEVFAYNVPCLRTTAALGFTEEGRLRGERYFDGVFHDVLRLGVLREEWLTLRQRLRWD